MIFHTFRLFAWHTCKWSSTFAAILREYSEVMFFKFLWILAKCFFIQHFVFRFELIIILRETKYWLSETIYHHIYLFNKLLLLMRCYIHICLGVGFVCFRVRPSFKSHIYSLKVKHHHGLKWTDGALTYVSLRRVPNNMVKSKLHQCNSIASITIQARQVLTIYLYDPKQF